MSLRTELEHLSQWHALTEVQDSHLSFVATVTFVGDDANSAVFITTSDEAYGIGKNRYGEIGTGNTCRAKEAVKIPELCKKNIIGLASGSSHSLGLTGSGEVYSWGWNEYGQLGHGRAQAAAVTPAVVPCLDQASEIACGGRHSLALTTSGKVYGWGYSGDGQCGIKTKQIVAPVEVQFPSRTTIAQISTSSRHSAALSDKGEIYCWGYNGWAALGRGEVGGEGHIPKLVLAETVDAFKAVSCGLAHTAGLTEDGLVMVWGKNTLGLLGVGSEENVVPTPSRVLKLPKASSILAKLNISLAETEDGEFIWGCLTHPSSATDVIRVTNSHENIAVSLKNRGPITFKISDIVPLEDQVEKTVLTIPIMLDEVTILKHEVSLVQPELRGPTNNKRTFVEHTAERVLYKFCKNIEDNKRRVNEFFSLVENLKVLLKQKLNEFKTEIARLCQDTMKPENVLSFYRAACASDNAVIKRACLCYILSNYKKVLKESGRQIVIKGLGGPISQMSVEES